MIDSVEKFLQIQINRPVVACGDISLRLRHCLMSRASRPKAIAVLGKRRVPPPQTSSINRFVLTGLSVACTTGRDSAASVAACWASPVGVARKSSLSWIFCRLSRLRLMSYSPLRSFGPSVTVPGSAYPLPPPFGSRRASLALPTP